MFTEEQINEILAVCGKATPGPWYGLQDAGVFTNPEHEKPIFETGCGCCTSADLKTEDADFIAISRTALPQLAEEVIKLRAVAEVAKHFYGICFDMPIDFPSAGPFVWGMGDLKDALAAAGYGGEE